MKKICFILAIGLLLGACRQDSSTEIQAVGTFTDGGIRAVIEIPAGTNAKIEFNKETGAFEPDQQDGKNRIIDFLPYPGNYGFIPDTHMDTAQGGDGDALDILVIAPSMKTGTIVEVHPIAALMLLDGGEIDTKIIAVPLDSAQCVIAARDYRSFVVKYHAAHQIIQNWFLNYKGVGQMELIGWKDERYAMAEIKKWAKKALLE